LGAHFSSEELRDGLELKSSSVEMTVLPLELSGCRIVFSIIFTPSRQSADKDVFEFISSHKRVRIEQAELSNPALEHVICKDVQLTLLWLIL
jgi:hypothetical protein